MHLHIDGNGTGFKDCRPFDRPFIFVGRDRANDVCLDDPAVSERHAYLQLLGGNVYCVDLGSRTGLVWDNGPSPSGWLQGNQSLRIGPYALRVESAAPQGQSANSDSFDPWAFSSFRLPPDQVVLEFVNGKPGSQWVMNRMLALVGRAGDCAIRLKAPGVADYHCSLLRTPRGLWAVGLDAVDGIYVNGRDVRWATLSEGDELAVGKVRIRVRQFIGAVPNPSEWTPNRLAQPTGSMAAPVVLPDEVVMPLLSQFTALQRQMFDQFQQAIYMMVEMFKKMEREQTELIRKEVDRIHDITEELRLLQMEIGHRGITPALATRESPAASMPRREATTGTDKSKPVASPAAAPTVRNEPAAVSGEPPASSEVEQEIQTWLYDQISMLQREREGRLKRLVNFLSGNG